MLREWHPITQEDVSKVIPDNRPFQSPPARGTKHVGHEVIFEEDDHVTHFLFIFIDIKARP